MMDLSKLREPFPADAIDWRIGQSGKTRDGKPWAKVLAYLTSRAVMDRLDEVVGPSNWKAEYEIAPHDPDRKSLLCTLSLRIDGEWIGKTDGANVTDVEPIKGCISDALKRAAVSWGIGRYLYGLGDTFADCREDKPRGNERDEWKFARTKEGVFYWRAPELPASFLPAPAPVDRKQAAMDAAKGKLKPASELPQPARGDDGDWHQWLTPPAEVEAGENPEWYIAAWKGLRHHGGARTAAQTRHLLAALWQGETPPTPQDVVSSVEMSRDAWERFLAAHQGGEVPFVRIVGDAIRKGAVAAADAEADG